MKLPDIQNADEYTGLYVIDFSDHCGVGFTAEEVAELLESEQFTEVQVYMVHRANPDGTIELKGVTKETFQLEAGMFFYAADERTGRDDYQRMVDWANEQLPPARCKIQLANNGDTFITALIYPAEYNDAFSQWLLDGNYRTAGQVEGGADAVKRYYNTEPEVLKRKQLWPLSSAEHLTGETLMEATNRAFVR
jgi:cyclophilin family peptidyl-prolyl cis-trans isomerase